MSAARCHPSAAGRPTDARCGPARLGSPMGVEERAQITLPSLGALKARHREDHLCFRCHHHVVCAMASALDPHLLVTITNCLAFDSIEPDAGAVCELMPIEALATQ
ncbi:MAG: hypothetical protein ABIY55_05355 [Kofleriaceae bacterium]